ncbi:MAG: lysophospholipase [Thiolinea sp.]
MLSNWKASRWLFLCIVGFCLTACTTASVPEGKSHREPALSQRTYLTAGDGTELAVYRWRPSGQPKANILLLHGFNEYSGAFDDVGQRFAEKGIAVWAFDQRGFGRSAHRGLWSSAERMAGDARDMLQVIRKQHPNIPLSLVGMSMGGAVTLLTASEKSAADSIVLVAPAVWIRETQPFYQRWALDVAKTLMPAWSPTGESLKIRPSDNIPMLRRIWKSPWMIRQSRIDAVAGLVDLMDKSYAAAEKVKLPALLLYGEKDELVPEKPVNMLWQRLPKKGKARQIRYPNGWHMLMRDLQGDKVISDITRWVLE